MKIGITGSEGLIGWHLRCLIRSRSADGIMSVPADRRTFESESLLDEFVAECDAIVHLAGMNRGNDADLFATNVGLAEQLVTALERTGNTPHVVFSSSTHISRGTPYGESKKAAAARFADWARARGALFSDLVLPHVFGEGGKPFYNSAISTFCYQLARGEEPAIVSDGDLELLHAGRVSEEIIRIIEAGESGQTFASGERMKVSEALPRLKHVSASYAGHVVPDVRREIDLDLFNTYRSYLYPEKYPVGLQLHSDPRGTLVETVKAENGGQTFFSTTKPGITRGNHFHRRKIERFCVLQGEAIIRIRKLFSDETREFRVSGERPEYIDIPTLHTHNITNVGSGELLTQFWAHEIFDPARTDTYAEVV